MASGTPVVTSDVSSLPEITGDAAQLIDPNDERALANALIEMMNNDRLRAELRLPGEAGGSDGPMPLSTRELAVLDCVAQGLSNREIADEIIRRGIIETISPRHAARLLKNPGPATAPGPVLADPGARRALRGQGRRHQRPVRRGRRPGRAGRAGAQHR